MHCILSAPDGPLYFAEPSSSSLAWSAADLHAFCEKLKRDTTQQSHWQVIYCSFEFGLLTLDHDRFNSVLNRRDGTPLAAQWLFGAPSTLPSQITFPDATGWLPELSFEDYEKKFVQIKKHILNGDIYQINLTFRAEAENISQYQIDPSNRQLSTLKSDHLSLYSLSPECFISYSAQNRKIVTRPIKGTIEKNIDFSVLKENPKEHAEHSMVVDMCRHDIGQVCTPGSIKVSPFLDRLDLPYATHLESSVSGTLREDLTIIDALQAMSPVASISGTPKHRACQIIAELEPSPRGPYTGILGWISPQGDAEFVVLIRTAWKNDSGQFIYGTGGGIVADSVVDSEFQEALLKTRAMTHG